MKHVTRRCISLTGISIFLLLTGCATIVKGPTQEVSFTSVPAGASVILDGRVLGQTPFTMLLKKKPGQAIVFEKQGYSPQHMTLTTRLDSWFWGNIVFGGVLGSVTDGFSGSVTEYSPSQYFITLSPVASGKTQPISKKAEAEKYIVTAYQNIVTELNSDTGEYVASLFTLLDIPTKDQPQAVAQIRDLSNQHASIPEFADQVTRLYLN
ncbi:PEGA domain-containing protein [Desulfoluna butyratoxydans]|uniref:Pega n=1 Tax=Desulfoluna butyratoxydans TaxID=231438 RepID=A0A4U8YL10_9BACT|nr:PEGA domain-containing protein [Desulfoluna butyratoxydans]VFQ44596.1 pega [Desulfoluna butyratoxydans]